MERRTDSPPTPKGELKLVLFGIFLSVLFILFPVIPVYTYSYQQGIKLVLFLSISLYINILIFFLQTMSYSPLGAGALSYSPLRGLGGRLTILPLPPPQ